MPPPDRVDVGACLEPAERELADGREHPEAPACPAPHEQALVHERGERLQIGREHAFDIGEIERAGEDREALEEIALVVVEQCVAPVDRRGERPVPLGCVLRAGAEEIETRSEAREQILRREQLRARGRELDRERQAVEPCAQLSDLVRVRVDVDAEPACALREQLRRDLWLERLERELDLAGQVEPFAARDEHGQVRARAQERRERRRGADHLLEVVEHEQ